MQSLKNSLHNSWHCFICWIDTNFLHLKSLEGKHKSLLSLSVAKPQWGSSILMVNSGMQCYSAWFMQCEKHNGWSTYGYIAIVVSLTKISLLGISTVLQVKAWGGGILCFLQNSAGEILYSCLTSCKSDFAATTKQGILLSMKCCCKVEEKVKETLHDTYNLDKPKCYWL